MFQGFKEMISMGHDLIPNAKDLKRLKFAMCIFWSAHQRYFRQLTLSAKVPAIVKIANEALASDKCVVIGLQSTGESRTSARIDSHGFQGEFISSLKDIPETIMEKFFYGGSGFDFEEVNEAPGLQIMRDEIMALIEHLDPPNNALDDLIDRLGGPTCVAEMTGRSARIVRRNGTLSYEKRVGDSSVEAVNIRFDFSLARFSLLSALILFYAILASAVNFSKERSLSASYPTQLLLAFLCRQIDVLPTSVSHRVVVVIY